MADSEDQQQEVAEELAQVGATEQSYEAGGTSGAEASNGTAGTDEGNLKMSPTDQSTPEEAVCPDDAAAALQPAVEPDPQEAASPGSASAEVAVPEAQPAAESMQSNIQAHPVPDLRPMTAAEPPAYPMASPLADSLPPPPQTAPAATGHLNLFRPPTRGTLALPNRGFRGRFLTRRGRMLTSEDMAKAVDRLSNAGNDIVDLQQLLQQYAHLPRPKTCFGKEFITPSEMEEMIERLYTHHPPRGMEHKSRPKPVKLTFKTENGQLIANTEPLPGKEPKESIEFLCGLYQRCREAQAKSQQTLADKYLQPLVKSKIYSGPEGQQKLKEVAQKLYAGESTK